MAITSEPTHFTEEDVLTLLPNLPDEESIYQLVNSTDAIFTENGLNELCDYGVDESLIRKISKRSGIPYADPDEPDEEIPLKGAQPKKPGLFSSILMGMAARLAVLNPKVRGRCTGDCARYCPPTMVILAMGDGIMDTEGIHIAANYCGNGGCEWEVQAWTDFFSNGHLTKGIDYRRQYGAEPEYPWHDRNAVLRHNDNSRHGAQFWRYRLISQDCRKQTSLMPQCEK
ncbi:MAG: hypothetical protein ACLU3U_07470 [Gallintestinimicrobium sp.]